MKSRLGATGWLGLPPAAWHHAPMSRAALHSRNHTLIAATVVLWSVAWIAWTADWLLTPMEFTGERALRRIPVCLLGALLCWGMSRLLGVASDRGLVRRLVLAFVLCVGASLIHGAFSELIFSVIAPHWDAASIEDWLVSAMTNFWVFAAWSALYFALDYDIAARDSRQALADAHADLLEAQNLALVRQVDPHFLFNALNTVSGLIEEGSHERADLTTLALARMLRGTFQRDLPPLRSLGTELAAQSAYLDVQMARFPDRFTFVDGVPAALRMREVPTLILQPLIENAFTHGVARSERRVTLQVTAHEKDGRLVIAVRDDAAPAGDGAHEGSGDRARQRRQPPEDALRCPRVAHVGPARRARLGNRGDAAVRLSAVIVDDEPVAVRRLQRLLTTMPLVDVVGTGSTSGAVRELIERLRPDLLFADIEMPGETGLALVETLDAATAPIVIFVTAFSEYALQAFGLDSADYLLKPVEPERLAAAVERARLRIAGRTAEEREEELRSVVAALRARLASKEAEPFLWTRDGHTDLRVPLSTILWLEAERDYVRLHTASRRYLVRDRLNAFERRLPVELFVRVHRSALVRRSAVMAIRALGDRAYALTLSNGDVVPVSRSFASTAHRLPREPEEASA